MTEASGRILIADDEDAFAAVLARMFRARGYACDTAPTTDAAVSLLRKGPYDVLLADLVMPGRSGLELAEDAGRLHPGLPVILITGHPTLDSAVSAVRMHVTDYLVKPFEFDDLFERVQSAIKKHRLRDVVQGQLQRIQEWSKYLETIHDSLRNPAAATPVTVASYVELSLHQIVHVLMDWKQLTQALSENRPSVAACALLPCPRVDALIRALRETIETLEQTKGAFRSKELGQLRRRLEILIEEAEPPGPPLH